MTMKTFKAKILILITLLAMIIACNEEAEKPIVEEKEEEKVVDEKEVEKVLRQYKVDTITAEFSAWNFLYRIGTGINLSVFEAPCEGCWSGTWQDYHAMDIKSKGFQSVRLPVRYDNKVGSAPDYEIDPTWMSRIDHVIDKILDQGLVCILDFHHINSLDDDPSQANQDMFVKVWEQLSLQYKDYSENLLFELYNEPKGNMTDEILNDIYQRAYAKIREYNPKRVIIIGGNKWNNAYDLINDVWFPENDKFVMGTFHRYKPNEFTHQKQGDNVNFMGTAEEIALAQDYFKEVSAWSDQTGIPVLLGEFGSVKWGGLDSRIRWTKAVVDGAKEHDFSMTYWCLAGGLPEGWNIYQNGIWKEELVEVLID